MKTKHIAFGKRLFLFFVICFSMAKISSVAQNQVKSTSNNHSPLDTTQLIFPLKDKGEFSGDNSEDQSPLHLKDPSNVEKDVEYDGDSQMYIFTEKVGDINYRLPRAMTLQEYSQYGMQRSLRNYWRQRSLSVEEQTRKGLIPELVIEAESFGKIFGNNTISIVPQGFVEVSFGGQTNVNENPAISERLRKTTTFDFDQQIQMSLVGNVGDKMKMQVNYNTESTFTFENQMNIEYTGGEDEIIKKIEAGNVSMPLNGSLITGATNLFGVKTEMQFGKLSLTSVLSQSEGERNIVNVQGGAQQTDFEISAADYDANRHFFLAHYFRNHYDEALSTLPVVRSSVQINRIEVWVTNKTGNYQTARNVLALLDLGEQKKDIYNDVPSFQQSPGLSYPYNAFPYNEANNLYSSITTDYADARDASKINTTLSPLSSYGFYGGQDYEKVEQARKLETSEYTINEQLGYISLNTALNNDEVLAVAYNYTANGMTFQVGEFSDDGINAPSSLVLKLLKGTTVSPKLPTWDLMMKNVYSLNAFSLSSTDFQLNVLYANELTGSRVNYLPKSNLAGHVLLNVLNLDNLNSQLDKGSNGVFDYIEGVTVNSSTGRIIFPVLEPFGQYLSDSIDDSSYKKSYAYTSLYDSTQVYAQQDAEHNKFVLTGRYSGSTNSEINLGAVNLVQGSVSVTSGGVTLTEGIDYVVDYILGRVKIINQAYLESGASLQVSTESQSLFTVQRKTLLGTHANYAFSDKFNLGATVLHMNERPITQKVNYGEDPISNTMLGLDFNYSSESQLLTDIVNKIPLIDTDAKSSLAVEGEYAKLISGTNNTTNGVVYIDDFENTESSIDVRQRQNWVLASTPQHQQQLFPEAMLSSDSLASGYNRARMSWFIIDPIFNRNVAQTPSYMRNDVDLQSNNLTREVSQHEIYPDKDLEVGSATSMSILNVSYYPEERGPYNFDTQSTSYSSGLNANGTLRNPESRWGGIMRSISTTNFQSANIEYLEFWMMDPFVNDTMQQMSGADLYFNFGDISEDVLKDSRKLYENGLPEDNQLTNVAQTAWGRVPTQTQITNAFVNNDVTIVNQDVGFDGLSNSNEQKFYQKYLNNLQTILDSDKLSEFEADPSADDYRYYRGSAYDQEEASILKRYSRYNGVEGNSLPASQSTEGYSTSATTIPDGEDVNSDNTLNEYERYYQYQVSLRREDMVVGRNNITDARTVTVDVPNGSTTVTWYRFRIPLSSPDDVFGNISDFTSIRFMRMFMRNSNTPVHLRFATLQLVRADWRKYTSSLETNSDALGLNTTFDVSAVNIEEDGNRTPVSYVLPPGVDRVIDPSNTQLLALNEQAMTMRVTELEQGDSRAAMKSINMDFRRYKNIKLDIHAEAIPGNALVDDDLNFFVRIGSDYTYNYYEYELPLKLTQAGTYSSNVESDRYAVWPDENRLNFPLSIFTDAKLARNDAVRGAGASISQSDEFSMVHSGYNNNKNLVKVKGNPSLGDVQVMMVGIRHKDGTLISAPKAVEVWVNELRLTEVEDDGGWAAAGRVSMKLADFGSLVFSGRHRSAGFGAIDQTVTDRSLVSTSEYDVSTNLELGKFFPEKARVQIPLYVGVSKSVSNPEYDPINSDLTLKETLAAAQTKAERDSIKRNAQDYSKRTSIVLNNVKVDQTAKQGKTTFYDPTNFSVSLAYNKGDSRDENTSYDKERSTRVAFNYNFNNRPKVYEPFKTVIKAPYLSLIRDFNFSLAPTNVAFRSEVYRYYNEVQTRDITNLNLKVPVSVEKDFLWRNNFNFSYNLFKSLEIVFSSEGTNRIDEPQGRLNRLDDDYQMKKDSIMQNLWDMGRPVLYGHNLNVIYQIPINKIPALNWIASTARYQGLYNWAAGAITDETIELGNTIDNSRSLQFNGQASFTNLYNKVPYLKNVNQRFSARSRRPSATEKAGNEAKEPAPEIQRLSFKKDGVKFVANEPKQIKHNLRTEDISVRIYDVAGKSIRGTVNIVDKNTIEYTVKEDLADVRVDITGKRIVEKTFLSEAAAYSARFLMMVKSGNITYASTDGTALPGFLPEPSFLGGGNYTNSEVGLGNIATSFAPGMPFLLGWQDDDFAKKAAEKGWITADTTLNSPYIMSQRDSWNFRLNLEPINSLKIDLTALRAKAENSSEYYLYQQESKGFIAANKNISGNFSMSVNTWGTAFSDMGEAGVHESTAYNDLLNNRLAVAKRLAAQRVENKSVGYDPTEVDAKTGFPVGYGPTSQEVLVPAFIAAYTGQSPDKVSLDPFPSLRYMAPNWRINYNGNVAQINGLNKALKSVAISHAYQSLYNVGSYQTNLKFDDKQYGDGYSYVMDVNDNFVSNYSMSSVNITELFNPLINLNLTWINDISTSVGFNRARNMTLSFSNNQLSEVLSREFTFGFGYKFPRMDLFIKANGKQKSFSNDLNLRCDVAVRKNKTVLRKLTELDEQLTAGQKAVTLKTSADYALSDRFQVRLYYDRLVNNPFTSSAFPTSTSNFGMTFRFTLMQ
ncbi:MAG: cell surface protein SprA [Mangrovibacterium sp.]